QRAQAAEELLLRPRVGGGDEYGVIAREGPGHFRPLGPVDRHGDALRGADGGAQHGDRGAGAPQLAHELRESAEVAVGARQLIRRQHVAAARLEHPEVAQVAADGRLGCAVTFLLQQAHQIDLLADQAVTQQAHDGGALYAQTVNLKPGKYELVSSSQVALPPAMVKGLPPGYLERLQKPRTRQQCIADTDLAKLSKQLSEERNDASCKMTDHTVTGKE